MRSGKGLGSRARSDDIFPVFCDLVNFVTLVMKIDCSKPLAPQAINVDEERAQNNARKSCRHLAAPVLNLSVLY